jgi:methylmalonyl-CoA mutase N-terminal domain/subunit
MESNVTATVDPLAGSWFVESLTEELEKRTMDYLQEIDRRGGTVKCIESGFIQNEIAASAYADQKAIDEGRIQVVGVNCFKETEQAAPREILRISPELERSASERVRAFRAKRSEKAAKDALRAVEDAAKGGGNLQELILAAVKAGATLGEISDALRGVFGVYREYAGF